MEDFLLKCFQKDIEKRASAKDLLEHPWFKQLQTNMVFFYSKLKYWIKFWNQLYIQEKPQTEDEIIGSKQEIKGESRTVEFVELKEANTKKIQVSGETIWPEASSKEVFITRTTTSEEIVQLVLIKYNSTDDPLLYSLFIDNVTTQGLSLSSWRRIRNISLKPLTSETKELDDFEPVMPYAEKLEGDEHFRFSLKHKPDSVRVGNFFSSCVFQSEEERKEKGKNSMHIDTWGTSSAERCWKEILLQKNWPVNQNGGGYRRKICRVFQGR